MRKLLLLIVALVSLAYAEATNLKSLKVENQENPCGVSVSQVRFSWQIESDKYSLKQVAYEITVSASENKFNKTKVWSSGKIISDRQVYVPYSGDALKSGSQYFWRVKVWTNKGEQLESEIATFSTALADEDWQAKWIGLDDKENLKIVDGRTQLRARYLRKEFSVANDVKRAMLYVSGVGNSVCYINGMPVGEDVLGPLPTLYTETTLYNTFDVTNLIKEGGNAIGVLLGNGRYVTMREPGMLHFGLPRMIAQLVIEGKDGNQVVISDETWKLTDNGPIGENNEFDGENYDARKELGDWTHAGYDDSKWKQAQIMERPGKHLSPQPSPSLIVHEVFNPISIKKVGTDRYIVDMGQNMVGWLEVKLQGKKEHPVVMRFAETLQNDSTLYTANLRTALVRDEYIPAKDGYFSWEPQLVYHGFRYVEITGCSEAPTVEGLIGKVVYDKMSTIGSFTTSNEVLNGIHRNAYWGIRGNYRGMPTDCPQRDERLGWLGDRATGAYGESFIFDNNLLYNKWLKDIEESMNEQGVISVVSPRYWTIYCDDVTWPSAYFYVADMLYRHFGDDTAIKQRYGSMRKWIKHMENDKMKNYLLPNDTYGDWCMPPESLHLIHATDPARKTKGEVLSTVAYYDLLRVMQEFAHHLGKSADALEYAELAKKVRKAYNDKYFNAETASYDNNTVTANILSLELGLVPEGYEKRLFESIIEKTDKDCAGHVSVGVLGIQHLMRGLTHNGAPEKAYEMATTTTYPSWGYMIENGATTIWELWNGNTADPAMNSGNHVMLLGDLLIWMYEDLAGIKNAGHGFDKIMMKPVFVEGLDYAEASYDSRYGTIESKWQRSGNSLKWNVTIPANTTATVIVPAKYNVAKVKHAHSISRNGDDVVIELGSGKYVIETE